MRSCLKFLADLLASKVKPRARLEAEIIVLRHQLNVLRRAAPMGLKLTNLDRLIFVWLYRLFRKILKAVMVVRPETVVRWHRATTSSIGAGNRIPMVAVPGFRPTSGGSSAT